MRWKRYGEVYDFGMAGEWINDDRITYEAGILLQMRIHDLVGSRAPP